MQERQLKFGASSISIVLSVFSRSLWPALKRGDGEERQHPHQHIVKVKVAVLPNSLPYHWMVHITIFEHHKRAPKQSHTQVLENNPVPQLWVQIKWPNNILALFRCMFRLIRASVEPALQDGLH